MEVRILLGVPGKGTSYGLTKENEITQGLWCPSLRQQEPTSKNANQRRRLSTVQVWSLLRAAWRKGIRSEESYKTLGRKALRWGKASVASAKIDKYMPAASGSHQSLRRIDQVGSNPLAGTVQLQPCSECYQQHFGMCRKVPDEKRLSRTQAASPEAVYRVLCDFSVEPTRQEGSR